MKIKSAFKHFASNDLVLLDLKR